MHDPISNRITIAVWDLPVRLFHWLLVALVALSWASGEFGRLDLHMILGKTALSLVLFRLLWGFSGSRTARFAHFVRGPRAILDHLRRPALVIGHNPLGALSVLALLTLVLVQAVTGLFTTDDIFTDGPLVHLVSGKIAALLSTTHRVGFKILLALVVLHVGAIAFYRFAKHDNLVKPMITGTRQAPASAPANTGGSLMVAAVLMVVSATAVWGGVALLS